MKYLEPVLSFLVTVARILFSGKRRKPPCCPCPYPDRSDPPVDWEAEDDCLVKED